RTLSARRGRNRFGAAFRRRVPRQYYWLFGARHRDPARSCRNRREPTRRVWSSPFPGQSIQLADVRTFRLGRYWGNHCPSGPGCDDAYCYILAARTEQNYANRLDLAATVSFRSGSGVGEKVQDARTVSAVQRFTNKKSRRGMAAARRVPGKVRKKHRFCSYGG